MTRIKLSAAAVSAILALGAADLAAAGTYASQGAVLQPALERSALIQDQPTLHRVQYRNDRYRDDRYRDGRYRDGRRESCRDVRKKHKRNGTVIGALGGGFLGSQVAGRGARTEGMLLGAGVGALAGREVGKSNARRRC